jgi:hypothetical protein
MPRLNAICALGLFLATAASAADPVAERIDKCNAALVPNEVLVRNESSVDKAFTDLLCGKWFSEHEGETQSTLNIGASAGLGVIGRAYFEKDDSATSHDVNRAEYCRDSRYRLTAKSKSTVLIRLFPETINESYRTCIREAASGGYRGEISLRARPLPASDRLLVTVEYDANYIARAPRLLRLDGENVSCEPIPPGATLQKQGHGKTYACRWVEPMAVLGFITVRTRADGDPQFPVVRTLEPLLKIRQVRFTPVVKQVCGEPFGSSDLHDMKWDEKRHDKRDGGDGRCKAPEAFGRFCTQDFYPNLRKQSGYTYESPTIHCVHDNAGSCAWNGLPKAALPASSDDPSLLKTQTFLGSHAIEVRLCAIETESISESGKQVVAIPLFRKRERFQVVSRPGENHRLEVSRRGGGIPQSFALGKAGAGLQYVSREEEANRIVWTYQDRGR